MSSTPKKPPASGSTTSSRKAAPPSTSTTTNGTHNRSPSRTAQTTGNMPASTASASTTSNVNRTRSVRTSTPMSARAAARKPGAATDGGAEDDAKAELQARLEELQEKLNQAETSLSSSQKHAEVLQIKLDEANKEQGILEDSVHEHTERIEELENEKRETLRGRREMEQIFESERAAALKEKEENTAREEEMQNSLQRMKEALSQREIRTGLGEEDRSGGRPLSISRASSLRSKDPSPNPEAAAAHADGRQFAPSSLQRSDSRSSSRLVMQKDKIIEGLRLELAEAQIKLVELENKGGANMHQLERDMYDIKVQNARLMEENESFQLLLSEKTLNGELGQSDLLRAPSNQGESRPSSSHPRNRASLADELDAQEASPTDGDGVSDSAGPDSKERRLHGEVNSLKDQNKALTIYINNIISRLLQHEQFEQILDKTPDLMAGPGAASRKYAAGQQADTDKELPPPPPPKDDKTAAAGEDGQPQGLLARAGSVLRGRGTRPARPTSQIIAPDQAPKFDDQAPTVHENPQTAPRIPLGRTASTRGGSGHRRANSDWPAASVVSSMYKGPSSGFQGPTSPGLGSPSGGRGSPFFSLQAAEGRTQSGNSVPTISEIQGQNENQAPIPPSSGRESKAAPEPQPRSNRNSVVSNPATERALDPEGSNAMGDVSSNPSSPPRSTTSSGDRDSKAASSGAVMMGSKPRPLRLVKEADDEKAKKAGANPNRGSWFGWMNKEGAAAASTGAGQIAANFMQRMPGRSTSGGEGAGPAPQ